MNGFTTDAIILKTSPTGEADLVVFALTRQKGVIRAFAKGARSMKSRLHSAIQPFTYVDITFSENKGVFHIREASVKEVFFALRTELSRMSLAQYFCEVVLKNTEEEKSEPEVLRLVLNCLGLMCQNKKPLLLIKSVFELRFSALCGYMPSLIGCQECGEYETEEMYFDCLTGALYCKACGRYRNIPQIPLAVVSAMRYIVFSDFERCFSFELTLSLLPQLSRLTEKYLQNCSQQSFQLLHYFYQYADESFSV